MGKLIDLTGKKFNKLTVLKRDFRGLKKNITAWYCKCDCGKIVSVSSQKLRNKETKSCGCLKLEKLSNRAKDITNLKVGRLTVLKRVGVVNKKSKWECLCECGNLTIVNYQHLKDEQVLSCGCYQKEVSANNGKKGGFKISGEKSHFYKPNLTNEDRLIGRNIIELRVWRKLVFEKDNYTCDLCNKYGSNLQAHHLNNWADHKLERFDVENGITLCENCHKNFHYSIGTRKSCTRSDYENYKLEKGEQQ